MSKAESPRSHVARFVVMVGIGVVGIFYAFLPGPYDPLAVPLSALVQLVAAAGVLLAPGSVGWIVSCLRARRAGEAGARGPSRWAFATLLLSTPLALLVALALLGHGRAIAVIALVAFGLAAWRGIAGLRAMRAGGSDGLAVAVHLVGVPLVLVLAQLAFAGRATECSMERAIESSADLIAGIEGYRATRGHFPSTLLAVNPDYDVDVAGIDRFEYSPHGGAFTLAFEQPTWLFESPGTREIVAYNPLDEHVVSSHDAWILEMSPEQAAVNQGWHRSAEGPRPHWKRIFFD